MVAGQPVRVLNNALLTDVHEDLLPTHGAHAVREVLGWHARLAVELESGEKDRKGGEMRSSGEVPWRPAVFRTKGKLVWGGHRARENIPEAKSALFLLGGWREKDR